MKLNILILFSIILCSICLAQVNFLPLYLNNEWYYYNGYTNSDTDILYKKSISDTVKIEDKQYFILTTTDLRWEYSWNDIIRRDNEGRIIRYNNGEEQIWFDFYFPEDSTYTYNDYNVHIDKDLTYTCEAGEFTGCVQLIFDNPDWIDDMEIFVFSNNVGIVDVMHGGEGPKMALKEYNLFPNTIDDTYLNVVFKYQLDQNYPNPFNPVTTIQYILFKDSNVKLNIYDVKGECIKALVDKRQKSGFYKIQWDASDFPSGVYFYQIKADNFQKVRKCLFLK